MDDLITWLRAQLDVDENGGYPDQHTATCGHEQVELLNEKCICGVPARVLREVEAKRLLLEDHSSRHTVVDGFCVEEGGPCTHAGEGYCQIDSWEGCRTQRLLALPFSDRPGYREEWRP